jgi:Cupredoxin-like domain
MKCIFLLMLLFPFAAVAADADYILVVRDHRFQPNELTVPSGKKIKLVIENQDATPEEFDSHALNREKMIAAHGSIALYIGPLDAGRYPFDGEFNEATAKGTIIAR